MTTAILTVIAFAFGASLASFWGQIFSRNQRGPSRSYCDHCKKPLRGADLIPIWGYLKNQGKSSCCQRPISPVYPFTELLNGLLLAAIFWLALEQKNTFQANLLADFLTISGLFIIAESLFLWILKKTFRE